MARNPFPLVTVLGSLLQVAMVLLGLAFPALQRGNFYPIGGTLLALGAGFLFARWVALRQLLPALVGGGLVGGLSSCLGLVAAAVTGQASPGPVVTVLIGTLTGLVAGSVGGFFGMLFRETRRPA